MRTVTQGNILVRIFLSQGSKKKNTNFNKQLRVRHVPPLSHNYVFHLFRTACRINFQAVSL